MLFRILAEFLLTFYRAATCVWSEDHRAARKILLTSVRLLSAMQPPDPSAVHTTVFAHEWAGPDVHVPLLSVVYSR